jgi:hypothetical protein
LTYGYGTDGTDGPQIPVDSLYENYLRLSQPIIRAVGSVGSEPALEADFSKSARFRGSTLNSKPNQPSVDMAVRLPVNGSLAAAVAVAHRETKVEARVRKLVSFVWP